MAALDIFGGTTFTSIGGAMTYTFGIIILIAVIGIGGYMVMKFLRDKKEYVMDVTVFVKQANGHDIVDDKLKRVYDKNTGLDYYHFKKLKNDIKKVDFEQIYSGTFKVGKRIFMEQISSDEFAPLTIQEGQFVPMVDPLTKRFLVERYSAHAKKFALGDFFQQYQGIIGVVVMILILMIYSIFMGSAVELTKQTAATLLAKSQVDYDTAIQEQNLTNKTSQLIDKIDYILKISETYNKSFAQTGTIIVSKG